MASRLEQPGVAAMAMGIGRGHGHGAPHGLPAQRESLWVGLAALCAAAMAVGISLGYGHGRSPSVTLCLPLSPSCLPLVCLLSRFSVPNAKVPGDH